MSDNNTQKLGKIILVEDDEGHATLVKINLEDVGINNEIVHLKDGKEALEYLQDSKNQKEILFILLDINLPIVTGFEVLEYLKNNQDTKSIPVLILTTSNNQRDIKKCHELGCNLYISKPIDYNLFCQIINNLGSIVPAIETTNKHDLDSLLP